MNDDNIIDTIVKQQQQQQSFHVPTANAVAGSSSTYCCRIFNYSNTDTVSIRNNGQTSILPVVKVKSIFTPFNDLHGMLPTRSEKLNTAGAIMCTVQTFSSPTSGPNLYLFTKYHSLLGFTVLIYDRFQRHYEYVKELIEPYGVIYHGYTPLELLLPSVYNDEYAAKQVTMWNINIYVYVMYCVVCCYCSVNCLYIVSFIIIIIIIIYCCCYC